MGASSRISSGTVAAVLTAAWITCGCAKQAGEGPDMPAMETLAGPAGRLHVDDGGKGGIPVVFVHSFAGSSRHWAAQLAHLRETRRAVAFDLRGHGQSDPPPDTLGYAVDSLARDIATVVDSLGIEKFVLVGHSMGGAAAVAYAGAHPDRVVGLVLVGTPGKSPPEQAAQVMAAMRRDFDTVAEGYWTKLLTGARPEVESRVRSDMHRLTHEASLAMIQAVFDYDPMPALLAYPGPELLIDTPHGESPSSIHALAPQIPRQMITGTSHWPHLDRPEEFDRILGVFLATAVAPPGL